MNIIFIAPPAAGKGTQSKLISNKYNIPHISTGDLLRNISDEKDKEYIKQQTQLGKLISDEFIVKLVYKALSDSSCDNGYILDGFPRDINQAIAYEDILKKLNKKLGYVFLLDISYDLIKQRVVGRLNCSKCGKIYNTFDSLSKPTIDNICDDCGSALIKRDDDNEKTFKKRYDTYLKETAPLISYYERKGVLHHIDASKSVEEIFESIDTILK